MTLSQELEAVGLSNITKTFKGIEYAYEKEGKFNTEFIAECIEYGEEFCSSFFAPKSYTKEQLLEIGRDIAMSWGAECIDVKKAE